MTIFVLKRRLQGGPLQVGGPGGGLWFPWEHQLLASRQEGRLEHTEL